MPTITLISGETAGLGFILSLCHDFRVQNPRGSSLCFYDSQFATPLLSKWMTEFVKAKLPTLDITSLMSDGKYLPAKDCLRRGLVDETGFFADVLRLVKRRRLLDAGAEQGYSMKKQLRNQSALILLDTSSGNEIKAHRL
jgi:enoyl-CoA hydratase/carnithine racemase